VKIPNQTPPKVITELLEKINQGDRAARDELLELVYPTLDRMARRLLKSGDRAAGLIRPSDLLNEAVLQIINPKPGAQGAAEDEAPEMPDEEEDEDFDPRPMLEKYRFENRAKFFAFVGKVMRHLITDRIRSAYGRKGDGRVFISLAGAGDLAVNPQVDWIPFDEALTRLEAKDEDAARVVELRILWEFTIEETAQALDTSPATVKRDFRYGKAVITKDLGLPEKSK
jgi:DNA-directed RNA polymerase specialized sigma24 family protein